MRGTIIPWYRKLLSQGNTPHKPLTRGSHRKVGKNTYGRITVRHRGGGVKRLYRDVDFLQNKFDIVGRVESVEYDPNRTAFISLVCYADGERRYIVTPESVKVGDTVVCGERVEAKPGNRMQLKNIPVGSQVYNVELRALGGAKIARSAGNSATLLGHDGRFAILKMPSLEVRRIPVACFASIGEASNNAHHLTASGKAGRTRKLGVRPTVRGTAMSAVDHPHGGGEGRAGRGRRRAVTKWGKSSGKGVKTRSPKAKSNVHIVRRRQLARKKRS